MPLGGFLTPTTDPNGPPPFKDADTAIITIVINNHYDKSQLGPAKNWEKAFLKFMENYTKSADFYQHFDIAYNTERGIEDELTRESHGEVTTIVISYLIMFLYISVSLGQAKSFSRLLVSFFINKSLVICSFV